LKQIESILSGFVQKNAGKRTEILEEARAFCHKKYFIFSKKIVSSGVFYVRESPEDLVKAVRGGGGGDDGGRTCAMEYHCPRLCVLV